MHYQILNKVIFQINFDIDLLKKELHSSIIDICKKHTKADLKENAAAINFTLSIVESQINKTEKVPVYLFNGERFKVQIQHNFIIIADNDYKNHVEFHSIIKSIFDQFNLIYNNPSFSKVALRYSNVIKDQGDTFDFNDKIESTLLGATLCFKDIGLTRSIGVISMRDDNGVNVNFTYGYLNPEYPNKIVKKEFILDYDCFKILNENILNIEVVLSELKNKANQLFNKSITQGLKDILNPKN